VADRRSPPVTPDLLEAQVRGSVPSSAPVGQFENALARARAQPQPETAPVYFNIRVDAHDRIWVEDHPINATAPRPWTVFDSTGRAMSRVQLPAIPGARWVELRSALRDTVLLYWRDDESGFPHLTLHALRHERPTH
jgi:hypothetical protein